MSCNEKCSYVPCLALKCDYHCCQPADTVPLIIIIRCGRSTERDSSCSLSRTHDRLRLASSRSETTLYVQAWVYARIPSLRVFLKSLHWGREAVFLGWVGIPYAFFIIRLSLFRYQLSDTLLRVLCKSDFFVAGADYRKSLQDTRNTQR